MQNKTLETLHVARESTDRFMHGQKLSFLTKRKGFLCRFFNLYI